MQQLHPSQTSVQLSSELWAEVFMHIEGSVGDGRWLSSDVCANSCFAKQAAFYSLRLVCQSFNEVFRSFPVLTRGLTLPLQFDSQQLPSLKLWLRRHASLVQTLAIYCGTPCQEATLTGLLNATPVLQKALLQNVAASSIHFLASFSSLTSCELIAPHGHHELALDPLLTLVSLERLVLVDGYFSSQQLPHQLKTLDMHDAGLHVVQSCLCVSSTKLRLWDSKLYNIHARRSGMLQSDAAVVP